ncbi:hypothetical protein MNBD_GAMMA18-2482 [hydrothermal vent metagenome]|uniref:Methyltransferase domain-containing protein n=1 Tax=hydrothermal vent metagenome TaxID=652676 RepID=A0A3B0ZKZ3_9ZZZZ
MDTQKFKVMVAETFDLVATDYDCRALRFFGIAAQKMVAQLALNGNEQVLDIACGTGQVAIRLAEAVPNGVVLGVDMSVGMLQQARRRAAAQGVVNIDFQHSDVDALLLEKDSLDVISSSFGLFFFPDIHASVRHLASGLKPNGRLIFSSFSGDAFAPMSEMLVAELKKYGIDAPTASWRRLDSEASHRELLQSTGFRHLKTERHQCGYHLESVDEWWDVLWNAGYRGLLMQLSETDLATFRADHLAQVAKLMDESGLWLNIDVLFTQGELFKKSTN